MMKYFDPRKSLDLTCPECSHKFSKTIGSINLEMLFLCPGCGNVMFDADDLIRGLKDAENAVDKLAREIKLAREVKHK